MKKWVDMREVCERLLTPNQTLDSRIFNNQKQLYPNVRERLLRIAENVAIKSVLYIPGLKIQDVCLRGSSAGYIYHENSDLDVKIMINTDNCNFLTKDLDQLSRFFMQMQFINLLDHKFTLDGRLIDIKIEPVRTGEFVGLYSIYHNRWIREPDRNAILALNPDVIMDKYSKSFYAIKEHLDNISKTGELNTLEGIYALQDYFADLFRLSFTSLEEFAAFKLLQKRGIAKEIRDILCSSIKNTLSV